MGDIGATIFKCTTDKTIHVCDVVPGNLRFKRDYNSYTTQCAGVVVDHNIRIIRYLRRACASYYTLYTRPSRIHESDRGTLGRGYPKLFVNDSRRI